MSIEVARYSSGGRCARCVRKPHAVVEIYQYGEYGSFDLCPSCASMFASEVFKAVLKAALIEEEYENGEWF